MLTEKALETLQKCSQAIDMTRSWPNTTSQDQELLNAAASMLDRAYAPYSGFAVGAALRTRSGDIYAGCNVENVSYPLGACGEQSALSVMIANGGRDVVSVAIISRATQPLAPCGGCRQRLAEFGDGDMRVLMATEAGALQIDSLANLLPYAFGKSQMNA